MAKKLVLNDIPGLIRRSTSGVDEFNYLSDYIDNADTLMYTNFGGRYLAGQKYAPKDFTDAKEYYENIVATILSSEEYRLKTYIESVSQEYNPISNYDMTETEIIGRTQSSKNDSDVTVDYGDQTINNTEWAYDGGGGQQTTTTKNTHKPDITTTGGTASGKEDVERTLTRTGNIGVTTAAQMLQEQRSLANFNVAWEIARLVACRITLLIWEDDDDDC